MSILKLTENLYISPQITPDDITEAQAIGIQSVICNRPNNEEAEQPLFSDIQTWLAAVGITHSQHQPVIAPQINQSDIQQFQQLLANSPTPVLAYCRTGTRSTLLWAYHQVQNGVSIDAVLGAAQQAGIDLAPFAPRLQEAAQHDLV